MCVHLPDSTVVAGQITLLLFSSAQLSLVTWWQFVGDKIKSSLSDTLNLRLKTTNEPLQFLF